MYTWNSFLLQRHTRNAEWNKQATILIFLLECCNDKLEYNGLHICVWILLLAK